MTLQMAMGYPAGGQTNTVDTKTAVNFLDRPRQLTPFTKTEKGEV